MSTNKKDVSSPDSLNLKVAEAKRRDVGRGIVRIDPKDMASIKASVGEIVEVDGERKTVAKLMPAFSEERGKGIVQMDGLIRDNAQVSLDEKVQIRKVSHQPAQKVIISPLSVMQIVNRQKDLEYIGSLLEGLPIVEGDKIRATLFGSRVQDFRVVSTIPKSPVTIHPSSIIKMKEERESKKYSARISYEDIGGLNKQIRRIREIIELPLKYPQVFERLGIDPPKGVLLHGPPGCGKTLIAKAVANETDAYFSHLSGPEIMQKFYGESEANLRRIFEKATSRAPSIIFLDEIDAIAPKREDMGGEKQVEKRVVAQLLALMDGLSSRGQVIVIGATNIPNVLDPALRRPGRFDREIEIGIPDKKGRLDILNIHTRGMPLAENVDLIKLAEITHGFVGADLESLSREAAMITLRKIFPNIDFQLEEIPYETIAELRVTMDDFMEAFMEVEPSAIREVFSEIPDVKWNDVGGLKEAKQILKECVEWPIRYQELYEIAGTNPPKGVLLYGAPGTGKTLLAKAVANESEANFISVKGPEILSKWVGESEKGVREVFKKAKQASPCIIFFDEIDSIVPRRGSAHDSGVIDRVISQFLNEMDGIEELRGILVLAATNRLDIIDPAMIRAGRFDFLLELPCPDEEARTEIIKVHTRKKPLADDFDLPEIVRLTEGMTGAEIESICRNASLEAIKEFIESENKSSGEFVIAPNHFITAFEKVKRERNRI